MAVSSLQNEMLMHTHTNSHTHTYTITKMHLCDRQPSVKEKQRYETNGIKSASYSPSWHHLILIYLISTFTQRIGCTYFDNIRTLYQDLFDYIILFYMRDDVFAMT